VIWAVLPLVMIAGLERIIFHTSHFAVMVGTRFSGTGNEAFTPHGAFPTDPMTHLTPIRFLGSPDLWLGILISAVFLAVAVRLRRSRGPI
jgi:hypothetical protein